MDRRRLVRQSWLVLGMLACALPLLASCPAGQHLENKACVQDKTADPTFRDFPKGWLPICPDKMELIRYVPTPICVWGKTVMESKPTQGEFKCRSIGAQPAYPACAK